MKKFRGELWERLFFLPPLLVALNTWLFLRHFGYTPYERWDILSYLDALQNIKHTGFDIFRTPLYPLIIGTFHHFFPQGSSAPAMMICGMQLLFYAFSVWVLMRIAYDWLKVRPGLCFALGCAYSLVWFNSMFACVLLTDSLASSWTIIYVWLVLRTMSAPSPKNFLLLGVGFIVLLALRPSFMFLFGVFAILGLIFYFKGKKKIFSGFMWTIVVGFIAVGIYSMIYFQRTGHFGVSTVAPLNKIAMQSRVINDFDRDELPIHDYFIRYEKGELSNSVFEWYGICEMAAKNPEKIYADYERVREENPGIEWKSLIASFKENMSDTMYWDWLRVYWVVIIASVYGIFLIYYFRKKKPQSINALTVWLVFMGNLAVVMLNAPREYDRLLLPVFPFLFVMLTDMLTTLFNAVERYRSENHVRRGCS